MSANKVYLKYQIKGVNNALTESFSVTTQSDAKKIVESKHGKDTIMYLNVSGPTMTPPAWFHG